MKERWILKTEKEELVTDAVWATTEEVSGRKTTAIVMNTDSKAAIMILESGMFYLSGPGMIKPLLFRIQTCNRARIEGCMFIKATQTTDTIRLRENAILTEMRKLLELDMMESVHNSISMPALQTVAS